jgi:hypothetical protein
MIGMHDDVNERMELRVASDLVTEYRPELAGFLGTLGLPHLLEEVFVPLNAGTATKAALSYEERPWPPSGIGARALRGMALAVISVDDGNGGQALLTPAMLSPQHATNVGLAAALTKLLLEDLDREGVRWVSLFVNERSKVVAGVLAEAGFEPRAARILTGQTEFTAHSASPARVLAALGLCDVRTGDVLALNLEREAVARLASYHLALSAGVANHWADRTEWAEVFPGFIDWAALPPGGITGTPGPGVDPIDPIVIVSR